MRLLIMGPPGVGKGTQAKIIKDKLRIAHISTGELLRQEIAEKTEFSKISLRSTESQVAFSLDCFITPKNRTQCQARLEINAELNIMMKMMVEKPLTQFLDVLANKIQNI